MGVTITLTDKELPASPAFIEFVHATLTDSDYDVGEWFYQEGESLARNDGRFKDIREKAQFVVGHPIGSKMLLRSYRFFKEMLTGNIDQMREISRFRFFFVIGIPRTGGTYLTKQLFRAANIDYKKVHNALAHDGFPHLSHLSFKGKANMHTNGLLQFAEYLTMVEIYFSKHGRLAYRNGVVVPKKFTKGVYYFDLIRELIGVNANYLLTLRHPLSICQSVIDKSGGMPEDRKYALRSAIERWVLDDWVHFGVPEQKVRQMGYVEALLGYWKRFHFQMAISGVVGMPTTRIVPYGAEAMTGAAGQLFEDFGVDIEPEEFKVAEPPEFQADEEAMAKQVVDEVEAFWKSLGLNFPREAIDLRF